MDHLDRVDVERVDLIAASVSESAERVQSDGKGFDLERLPPSSIGAIGRSSFIDENRLRKESGHDRGVVEQPSRA